MVTPYLLACLLRVHPLRSQYLFWHHESSLFLLCLLSAAETIVLVKYSTAYEITLTIDQGRTHCVYLLVFVCVNQ